MRFKWITGPLTLTLLLAACTAVQQPLRQQIVPAEEAGAAYLLVEDVKVKVPGANPIRLSAGTSWTRQGTIPYGDVYRTKDQIVLVNSFNVHEADIVVIDGKIVGCYLPVEGTFVAVESVGLKLVEEGEG